MTAELGVRTDGGDEPDTATAHRMLGLTVDASAAGGSLVVDQRLLNSGGTLWGGCGLAVAMTVGETVLDRSCLWATVQYISPITVGERLDLHLDVGQHGRSLSQASVRGTVDGRLALLAMGTFGGRPDHGRQFTTAPEEIPPPQDCPARSTTGLGRPMQGMLSQIEQRWARPLDPTPGSNPGSGHCMLWARLRQPLVTSSVSLAILADLAPAAVTMAVTEPVYTLSLDNSLRVGRITQSDWVLVDARVDAVTRNVAQVNARIFDQGGQLLAIASQSAKLLPPARIPRP
ncbi:thioesterase family protein [Frankia sp. Cppng1_Ct_nod]|uniref:acyl-CoA thioesterase n=1 Tax=Frankia sp. Cppng1_Ct_nod TaxID=2897162 RepID=UPI00104163CF|nr:thioesterase family protein [Frankia sp. Cppng1_Ct_nod]